MGTVAINPRTAGVGYLTDTSAWLVVAGVFAGAMGTKTALRAAPGLFGVADTATALSMRETLARAALSGGVVAAGIALSTVGGAARPLGLGLYALGLVHLAGRIAQAVGWELI